MSLGKPGSSSSSTAPPPTTMTGLSDADRLLIERFLARRATLDRVARIRLCAQIAERVRPTLRADYSHLSDEALLEFLVR